MAGCAENPCAAADTGLETAQEGSVALADRRAWQRALMPVIGCSEGRCELVEGVAEPVAGGDIGGELIVTAAKVLDEGVSGGNDPRGPMALESAHRPAALSAGVIGSDRVVRVAPDGVQSPGNQPAHQSRRRTGSKDGSPAGRRAAGSGRLGAQVTFLCPGVKKRNL
jgi:hypothetical protein